MFKRLLPLLALLCAVGFTSQAQLLEDFENGTSTLNWEAVQGEFQVVQNPDSNRVNMSAFVGKYTKDSTSGFSLFRAVLPQPLDLTTNNQFFVDVRATEDTRFIAKLEGPGGQAIEASSNIPVANQWRRYRFDFSDASGLDSLNTILFFFDFGNAPGQGMYFFDNVRLGTDPCAGVDRDLTIVDDFECQRAPIRAGFDSLFVVPNPDPDAVNGPGLVGEFRDPPGGFAALVYNFSDAFDLNATPILKLKYYAPIDNRLLVKLEGGTSPGREIGIQVTDVNEWQEYSFDFSAFAGENFRSLTIFTNAGEDAPGVKYYFDDIRFEAAPPAMAFEDFEGATTNLFWQPANNNAAVNGTFRVVDNPDPSGLNTTARVGEHVKGSSMLSTLVAQALAPLDLSTQPQLNMLLYAPAGSMTVRLTAVSATQGRLEVDRDIPATGEWVMVGFNLSDFSDAVDVTRLEFVFDPTLGGARTYYFDELSLGTSSIDPCDGTDPIATIIDDYECQRNASIFAGADALEIVNNPDTDGNPSPKVGQYTDPNGQPFAFLGYEVTEPFDLEVFNRVAFDFWSPVAGNIIVKFEGSQNGSDNVEVTVPVDGSMTWQDIRADLSAASGGEFTKLLLFINAGVDGAGEIYYIDNLRLARGPLTACVADFETRNTTIDDWGAFAGGSANDNAFAIVPNPDQSGLNTSPTVARFLESADGMSFAGIFKNFGAPVLFPDPNMKEISMLVWSPDVIDFVVKLEAPAGGGGGTGDVFPNTQYSTPGEWQELT